MIISHKNKFIFLKTEKTAGTSIEIALSAFCGDDDIITPLYQEDELKRKSHANRGAQNYFIEPGKYGIKDWARLLVKKDKKAFYNHISASEVKKYISPEIWNSYYKFAFERNPWDKVISWYFWTYKSEPRPSIKEFIKSGYVSQVRGWDIYAERDNVVVDRVGRYESLDQDIQEICSHLNLPGKLELPKSKSGFRKDSRSYREVFDEEDREQITRIFSREIQYLGYTF